LLRRSQLCVTFSVLCQCRERSTPQTILNVIGLPVEDFHRLKRGLLALRGQDLSPAGATLSKRLLNTEVASCRQLDGLLRATVEDHVDLIAQTIVLANRRTPINAVVPWNNHLSDSLRIATDNEDETKDTLLAKDIKQIVDDLKNTYGGQLTIES
jgi:hypothetical protein